MWSVCESAYTHQLVYTAEAQPYFGRRGKWPSLFWRSSLHTFVQESCRWTKLRSLSVTSGGKHSNEITGDGKLRCMPHRKSGCHANENKQLNNTSVCHVFLYVERVWSSSELCSCSGHVACRMRTRVNSRYGHARTCVRIFKHFAQVRMGA